MNPRDVQPTEQHLQRAWDQLAASSRRCPGTLESCLASSTWSICLQAMAKRLALRELQQPAPATQEPRAAAAHHPLRLPQRPTFDARRAAANDRDDD